MSYSAYSAQSVANEFLALAKQEGEGITHMKLQKLVYIAHGFSLALLNRPLISDEVQAWQYGPVIPTLYQELKIFGKSEIIDPVANGKADENRNLILETPFINPNDEESHLLIEAVWNRYRKYSGANLSDLTHRPKTPWEKVYSLGKKNVKIPDDIIKSHYEAMVNE